LSFTFENSRVLEGGMNTFGLDGQMARDKEPWTDKEDALLGTDKDRVIAAKLKRSSTAVFNRRVKLGIAAFGINRRAKQPDANKNDPASDLPGFVRVKFNSV
jgi:hypothetical protein